MASLEGVASTEPTKDAAGQDGGSVALVDQSQPLERTNSQGESLIGQPDPEAAAFFDDIRDEKASQAAAAIAEVKGGSGAARSENANESESETDINWGFEDMEELLEHEAGPIRKSEDAPRVDIAIAAEPLDTEAEKTPTEVAPPQAPGVDLSAPNQYGGSRSFPEDYVDDGDEQEQEQDHWKDEDHDSLQGMIEKVAYPEPEPSQESTTAERPKQEPEQPTLPQLGMEVLVEDVEPVAEPEVEAVAVPVIEAVVTAGPPSPELKAEEEPPAAPAAANVTAMGSEVEPPSDRYEEGLPLLAASLSNQVDSTPPPNAREESGIAFESDDFFDNITEGQEHAPKASIERKSTEAAMGIANEQLQQKGNEPEPTREDKVESVVNESKSVQEPAETGPAGGAFDDDFFDQLDKPETEQPKHDQPLASIPIKEESKPAPVSALSGEDDDFFDHLDEPAKEETKPEAGSAPAKPSIPDAFAEDPDDAFLEDDDDEFLPSDDEVSAAPPAPAAVSQARPPPAQPQPSQNYFPQQPTPQPQYHYQPQKSPYGAPPVAAAPPKPVSATTSTPESFVTKAGHYHSPYDLPADFTAHVKRKPSFPVHPSQQHAGLPAPPRSTSIGQASPAFPPPPGAPPMQRTGTQGSLPLSGSRPGTSSGTPQTASFFEELPMVAKPKPNTRYAPSPQPPAARPGSVGNYPAVSQFAPPASAPPAAQGLPVPPPPASSRYSPAPKAAPAYASPPAAPAQNITPVTSPKYAPSTAAVPAAPTNSRYVPAAANSAAPAALRYAQPPATGASTKYAPPPTSRSVSTPITTQFAKPTTAAATPPQRQVSNPIYASPPRENDSHALRHAPEMHQLHSARPPTGRTPLSVGHELQAPKEEDELAGTATTQPETGLLSPISPSMSMPPPSRFHNRGTATPPPSSGFGAIAGTLSPPKVRAASPRYTPNVPQRQMSAQYPQRAPSPQSFVPPPRAQTQSPGTAANGPIGRFQPKEPYRRPSSALAHAYVPTEPRSIAPPLPELQPPNDPSAHDPLARWQGAPVFKWGSGGNVVSMFPKRVQRFTAEANGPITKSFPGEVRIKQAKDYAEADESITSFPGPLVNGAKGNKAKKKEVLSWLDGRIAKIEDSAKNEFGGFESTESEERALLWRTVRLLVEHDGAIEGTPELEKAVRSVLWPQQEKTGEEGGHPYSQTSAISSHPTLESASAADLRDIKEKLLAGDRSGAAWLAVDKRLWSHAMIISSTISTDVWKQVVQEFVKNEVKTLGSGCETISALYEIFSGSGADAIDELVPQSARMGMPMLNRSNTGQVTSNPLESLRLWKETLALIVSNRSPNDVDAILALARLLKSYGRSDAAQICFIFARQLAVWSGADDAKADFVLLGADQSRPELLGKDLDSVLLSEVFEYAISLPTVVTVSGAPHLQIYKLFYAEVLAQNGHSSSAQKYCDAIAQVLRASSKPSPYYQMPLFAALDDLTQRLQESPKDDSGSWLKPNLNDVSGSIWAKFNKFVAGDEDNANSKADADSPFAKVSPSPTISRSESTVDMYSAYNSYGGPQGMSAYGTMGNPQYNSSGPYAPRTSSESMRYGPQAGGPKGRYDPQGQASNGPYGGPVQAQQGYGQYTPSQPFAPQNGNYSPGYPPQQQQQQTPKQSFDSPLRNSFDAEGVHQQQAPSQQQAQPQQPAQETSAADSGYGGYQPPSYEPPTYEPYQPEPDNEEEDKPKPKKKSFMDDDDDEFDNAALKKIREEEEKKKEEEAKKKAESEKSDSSQKSGWFGGWFRKKDDGAPKAIKAKLGEESSFYYDPELKRWVNKKAGAETPPVASTPPPPRASPALSRPPSVTPSDPGSAPNRPPLGQSATAPPPPSGGLAPPPGAPPTPGPPPSSSSPAGGPPPPGGGLAPPRSPAPPLSKTPPPPPASAPPGKVGGGDPMDDLLGPPGARRAGGAKKGRKGGRYVDVMAK